MDPMESEFMTIEDPLSGQNSSTDTQLHTQSTLHLDTQNVINNIVNVNKPKRISRKRYIYLLSSLLLSLIFYLY